MHLDDVLQSYIHIAHLNILQVNIGLHIQQALILKYQCFDADCCLKSVQYIRYYIVTKRALCRQQILQDVL